MWGFNGGGFFFGKKKGFKRACRASGVFDFYRLLFGELSYVFVVL